MISSSQIKAARALLGWTALDLAERSGIGPATLRRWELQEGIPAAKIQSLMMVKEALENTGIEFTGDPLVNPGVILHLDHQRK
ncbi:helix-turn-helix domain-containing protein [Mariprofundus ferrinatatus]|uniref:helix-turn-helix domain-containing protein n=1 Tax=Mariprofundus ferrinatatus TaxID=1921087 RepID=UPI000C220346